MSRQRETVVIRRPVRAESIPDGTVIELPAGTRAQITQALGSSFTVYVEGYLLRIAGVDADALGKEPPAPLVIPDNVSPEDLKGLVWQTLKTCYDPEIPVDIVALGLVYVCDVLPMDEERFRVSLKMTVTAPGCGMGEGIAQEVQDKLEALPHVGQVDIEIVFDPPWDRSMMSEEAELMLGL
ncbi:putative Fe-S cluster assembly protein SufT [Rhodoferax sp.]|uniref:putative Fe-S cluster assembly protein SufT n=1 Tax=Rhodoferax sp. TaxID=50421 RepID=UPI0027257525|nr:putative Fe-S cluster assembly protein SufT [Rhodoferax sp.]MDO9198305.1 putative Fe-S cluster assembly protein SufT [Rhodoferax sp.]